MDTVLVHVRPGVTDLTVLYVSKNLGISVIYERLSIYHKFHENKLGNNDTLQKGAK